MSMVRHVAGESNLKSIISGGKLCFCLPEDMTLNQEQDGITI
jgi:hypothetical protein